MGELTKILNEFDIRFADRDDDEDRSEFSFGDDGEDMGDDDDRRVDFRGDSDDDHEGMDFDGEDPEGMDFGDDDMEDDEEDTFAGEKRVDITAKLRNMLGLDAETGDEMGDEDDEESFKPSLSDLDLDSEEEEDDGEFDFDVFNKRGAE